MFRYLLSQDSGSVSLKDNKEKERAKMEKIMNNCRSCLPEEICVSKPSPCQNACIAFVGGDRKLKNKSHIKVHIFPPIVD